MVMMLGISSSDNGMLAQGFMAHQSNSGKAETVTTSLCSWDSNYFQVCRSSKQVGRQPHGY